MGMGVQSPAIRDGGCGDAPIPVVYSLHHAITGL
jgi:hypothetical protein